MSNKHSEEELRKALNTLRMGTHKHMRNFNVNLLEDAITELAGWRSSGLPELNDEPFDDEDDEDLDKDDETIEDAEEDEKQDKDDE